MPCEDCQVATESNRGLAESNARLREVVDEQREKISYLIKNGCICPSDASHYCKKHHDCAACVDDKREREK